VSSLFDIRLVHLVDVEIKFKSEIYQYTIHNTTQASNELSKKDHYYKLVCGQFSRSGQIGETV